MILGMTTSTFTLLHVLLSLAGIGTGFIVVYGMLTGKRLDAWTAIFLAATVLTSLTGFLFPVEHLLPSHVVGAVLALYLNSFVAVVQSFLKVPALKALAPTQKEPPFVAAQLGVMAVFIVLGIFAVKKFQVERIVTA
jgi:hypothetical protein